MMNFLVGTLVALALAAGGCASTRPGPVPEQSIPVEIHSTSPITILNALAVRENGKILVSGILRQPSTTALPGHVDVVFLGSDGSILHEHRIAVAGLGSRRGGVHEVPFGATLDLDLPAESRAVIGYHSQL